MVFLTLTNILSFISLVLTAIAILKIGKLDKNGFLLFNVSLNCQIIIFYMQKNWFLALQMVVLIGFNTYTYLKWKRDEGKVDV